MVYTKKTKLTLMLPRVITGIIAFFCGVSALPLFSQGDAFLLYSWTRKENDSCNYGYKLVTKVNSQVTRRDSTLLDATIRVAGLPLWFELVKNSYGSLTITFCDTKPHNIIQCSPGYQQCSWLQEIRLVLDSEDHTIRFQFPIPDSNQPYRRHDYFTIAVNDSIHLQFQGVQDSIFMGSFLNNNRRNDPESWLMAKAAIMVRTSAAAPFRIRTIEMNAAHRNLITTYLGSDLSRLSNDCDYYGIDFADTSINEEIITVRDVTIAGAASLIADSSYDITWKTVGKGSIRVCSLYVSSTGQPPWIPVTATPGDSEHVRWVVPANGETQCAIQVIALGYDGQRIQAVSTMYPVFNTVNFTLTATALTNTSVALRWNNAAIDTSKAVQFLIAYRTATPVLTYPVQNTDTLQYRYTCTADTIDNLQPGGYYHFSAFMKTADGSFVLLGFDSVLVGSNTPPVNSYQLTLSSDTSRILLTWKSTATQPTGTESIGIFMCSFRYPVSHNDSAAELIKLFPAGDSSLSLEQLTPEHTYYFALLVKDSSGNWSQPAEQSLARGRIERTQSTATLFPVTVTPSDTLRLFHDSLRIWGPPGVSCTDTLEIWSGPHEGFITGSTCFVFRNGDKIDKPLWIQLTCKGSLDSELISKIYPYQYNLYTGEWVIYLDTMHIDTLQRRFTIKNSSPAFPFMLLVDTLSPVVTLLSTPRTPLEPGSQRIDTISVSDNIGNYTMHFSASPGNKAPVDLSHNIALVISTGSSRIFTLTLPPGIASSCSGLRSLLRVSDHVNTTTVNLSHPVLRGTENCDNTTTEPLQWTPVLVSALPEKKELARVMQGSGSESWKYDREKLRIVQWISGHSKAFDKGWVEYRSVADSLFDFNPGKLFWFKTKEQISVSFGSAMVPALIDTPVIKLNPGTWTDLANPFAFDIYIGDVLAATRKRNSISTVDSIEIYSWIKKKKTSYTTPLYLPHMPGLNLRADTIKGGMPFTIYTPGNKVIHLAIPPVSIPVSSLNTNQSSLMKKGSTHQWSFRINASTGEDALSPVYCGYSSSLKTDIRYPSAPSFSKQRIAIYNPENRETQGSVVSAYFQNGIFFEVVFENNDSKHETIQASIGDMFNLHESIDIRWFDPELDQWSDMSKPYRVSLGSHEQKVKIVAAGDETYFRNITPLLQKNSMTLHAPYPNPFNRFFTINYSLPYNVKDVSFRLFNVKGQCLWSKSVNGIIQPGPASLNMDMHLAAGMYVVQMKVQIEGSDSQAIINRMVLCTK